MPETPPPSESGDMITESELTVAEEGEEPEVKTVKPGESLLLVYKFKLAFVSICVCVIPTIQSSTSYSCEFTVKLALRKHKPSTNSVT